MNPFTHAVVGLERDTGRVYLIRMGHKKIQKKSTSVIGKDRVKFQFEASSIEEAIPIAHKKLDEFLDRVNRSVEIEAHLVNTGYLGIS